MADLSCGPDDSSCAGPKKNSLLKIKVKRAWQQMTKGKPKKGPVKSYPKVPVKTKDAPIETGIVVNKTASPGNDNMSGAQTANTTGSPTLSKKYKIGGAGVGGTIKKSNPNLKIKNY